jgi:8-oxo-dGTP pyrophosphatase MutT (NUDIX family)
MATGFPKSASPESASSKSKTAREFSAGGVVVRYQDGEWQMAAIEPAGRGITGKKSAAGPGAKKQHLTLPKGVIDPGETPAQAAVREVREETGLEAELIAKLGDVRYVYLRSWGDGSRVFKVVTFYLLRYRSGSLGDISPEMRIEVADTLWLTLTEAATRLAYSSDKKMVKNAIAYLEANPLPAAKTESLET